MPRRPRRVGPGQQLILAGTRPGWQLASLEVGNVYGYSNRIPQFVIVPRERQSDRGIPLWGLGLFAIVALLVQPKIEWPADADRATSSTALPPASCCYSSPATLLAQNFHVYKILLLLDTFILCAAVLYAEPLSRVWYRMQPHVFRVVPVVAPIPSSHGGRGHRSVECRSALSSRNRIHHIDRLWRSSSRQRELPALRAVPHHIEAGARLRRTVLRPARARSAPALRGDHDGARQCRLPRPAHPAVMDGLRARPRASPGTCCRYLRC